ncbi:MAG: iron-sulfur cluster assembly accessory protein [Flavisolibacter sp.]
METQTVSPIKFTPGAVQEIIRLMQDPALDPSKKLKVGVKGGGCSGMTYILGFDYQKDGDDTYDFSGISFIMEKSHEIYLYSMEIDYQGGLNSRGFTFKNPNASTTCGCGTSFAV